MPTQTNEQKDTGKADPQIHPKSNGKLPKESTDGKPPRAKRRGAARTIAEDAFAERIEPQSQIPVAAIASDQHSTLVTRGKDLLSGDAGSVATAAAIVVGAALIEIELIPGLIIGAGAILLGKFFPEMSSYVRPVIKGAVRAGFSMGKKAREIIAETSEQVHDMVAEVKHEQEQPPIVKTRRTAPKPVAAKDELLGH